MILLLFSSSKFPVGSSAKITFAPVAKVLPMATLCCSPPDKLDGYLDCLSSSIPMEFNTSCPFSMASSLVFPYIPWESLHFLKLLVKEIVEMLEISWIHCPYDIHLSPFPLNSFH